MKISLLLLVLLFQSAASQVVEKQDPPASVTGVVIHLGTSNPIPRTTVLLNRLESSRGLTLRSLSEPDGTFSFDDVPPGRYRVIAVNDGYVPSEFGQDSPGQIGTPITLSPNQHMSDIAVRMTPVGSISGTISDEFGDPVPFAMVEAFQFAYRDGQRTLRRVYDVRANDLGEYRLYWMEPGSYVVSAIPPQEGPNSAVISNDGSFTASTVRFSAATNSPIPAANDVETYVPVYYPGTPNASEAESIDVRSGVSFTGVDLTVASRRTVNLRGRVVNALTGQPQRASITLFGRRDTDDVLVQQTTSAGSDGVFELRGVIPGTYDLVAVSSYTSSTDRTSTSILKLLARMPMEINGQSISDIVLPLRSGFELGGKVALDSRDSNSRNLSGLRVQLREKSIVQMSPQPAVVAADGTFTLRGLHPGEYTMVVASQGRQVWSVAATFRGQDVLRNSFRLEPDADGQFDILLSSDVGTLEANVRRRDNEPAAGITVVLVPGPPNRNRSDLYRSGISDASGRVRIDGIMPGEYKVFAWEEVDSGAWEYPDFIRPFEDRGSPLVITGGVSSQMVTRAIDAQ